MNTKFLIGGAALSLIAAGAQAHHSVAMFDQERTVELHGVVTQFQYTNPHSWLIVDVRDEDGGTTTWGFEAEGPGTLMRRGIGKNTFRPGAEVTVRAHPMKDGRPAGQWIDTTLADGRVLSATAPTPVTDASADAGDTPGLNR